MGIDDWRKQIDELDRQLVGLLNQRARCAAEIGRLKRSAGEPLYQPEREQEIFERVQQLNEGPLSNEQLRRLFESIVGEARSLE